MENTQKPKIVFMGTPDFAVGILRTLIEADHNVVGVVTVPDKPAGRGRQLRTSAVKDYTLSLEKSIKLMQPEKLRNEEFISDLKELDADLFIVVAFRMLPEMVWAMPRLGTFNLHASLLPNYRGAAPINWAIINGETVTGVTTFLLNHEIDCGAIIDHAKVEILPEYNVEDLHDKLMEVGSQLVLTTVEKIASGSVVPLSQDEMDLTTIKPAPKLFKENMQLHFDKGMTATELHNKVRGLSPYPVAWAVIAPEDKSEITAKVYTTHIQSLEAADDALENGTWQTDGKGYLRVKATGGWLYVDELQPQNKKRMATVDFLRGWR